MKDIEKVFVILGGTLRFGRNVRCILPLHGSDDQKPSARIYVYPKEAYFCFKCTNKPLDAIGLVREIKRCTDAEAKAFLVSVAVNVERDSQVKFDADRILATFFSEDLQKAIDLTQGYYNKILDEDFLMAEYIRLMGEKDGK